MRNKKSTEETLDLMAKFGRHMRSKLRGGHAPSIAQLEALQFVAEHDCPTMRDIARHLQVKAPSATSLIGELVRSKMLVRRGDPNDRRHILLEATSEGRRELNRITKRKKEIISAMLRRLDEKDKRELSRLLHKVLAENNH